MDLLSNVATTTDGKRNKYHHKQSLDVGSGDNPDSVLKVKDAFQYDRSKVKLRPLLELGKKNHFPQCVLDDNGKSRKKFEKTSKIIGGAYSSVRKSREEVNEVLEDDVCFSALFHFAYALARLGQTFAGIKGCKEFLQHKFSVASDAVVGDSEAEFSARVAKSIAAAEKRMVDPRANGRRFGGALNEGSNRVSSTKKAETVGDVQVAEIDWEALTGVEILVADEPLTKNNRHAGIEAEGGIGGDQDEGSIGSPSKKKRKEML